MSSLAIELAGLAKTFGTGRRAVHAVRGIDLKVRAGQVYGFLGANGAGKSTTIRMIVDLVRPSAGEIRLFGESLRENPRILDRVGALVEGAVFYPHLSGRDNLEVLARTRGDYSPREIDGLLQRLNMTDRADRPVEGYSMGMKQRLGVASALLGRPRLVILDEPTNGLDPAGIREMRGFIRQLAEDEGITVFLSSHLLTEVEQVCDQVAIIDSGAIVRQGTLAELLHDDPPLRIEVSPLETAAAVLAESWQVEQADDALLVDLPADLTPEAVRRLTAAQLDVFDVRRERRSLESYFFDVTSAQASPSEAVGERP